LRAALTAPLASPGGPPTTPAALLAAPCGPPTANCCCLPSALCCPASPRSTCCTAMALLRVLAFDHEGRPIQFDTWLDDLQLYLLSDSRDSVSLFDHTSCAAPTPPATAHTRALYNAVVTRYFLPATAALGRLLLPYLFPELSAFATVEDLVSHLRASDARYRVAAPADSVGLRGHVSKTKLATLLQLSSKEVAQSSVLRSVLQSVLLTHGQLGGKSGPQRGGPGGGRGQQQQRRSEIKTPQQLREWLVQRGVGEGSETCPYVIRTGVRGGRTCGRFHTEHRCCARLDDVWRYEFGDDLKRPRWAQLLQSGVANFDTDFDVIISAMYALSFSAEGDCYRCVPSDPCIAAAALGASASGTPPSTAPAEALHTFTLDLRASCCFVRNITTLTPLPAPVPVRKADPSRGPVIARSSTVFRVLRFHPAHYHVFTSSRSLRNCVCRSARAQGWGITWLPAVAVVLERQMAALRIEEDEAVEKGVEKFFDLLTRLEGADLNYSELQKKTKLLAFPESWSSLIINLNRDLPRLSLEDVKRAILQEDFRRRELASADGAGAASIGQGYGRGRGRGQGGGRFGSNNFNGGRGSGGYGSENKSYGRGRSRFDGQEGRGVGRGRGRGRGGCGGREGGAASMKSASNESESRDDRFPGQFFFVSTQALAAPEKDESFEEPAVVGKVTLHYLDYWMINIGATYSMTPRADLLAELEPSPIKRVTLALGQRAEVKGMGKAMFKGADGKMVGLKNVLWVPNLAANLISMDVYKEMWQIRVVPMPKERQVAASISTKGEAVGSGDGANGRAKEMKSKKCNLGGTSKLGEHEESGAAAQKQHKGEENPKAAAKEEYGESISEATAKGPLDEVVMDVVGPLKLGAAGAKYFLTIVDVYTCMTWVYVQSKKSDVAETVKTDWLPMVERQQDRLVKSIRTDRGEST
ncbi:unnamed protein product, partial [Closterium sp. NIES-53]